MVIVSNGFQKFHLSVAAAEAYKRGALSCYLTGAYPTSTVRSLLAFPIFRTSAKAKRLLARQDEIPDSLVHPLFSAEALNVLGILSKSQVPSVAAFRYFGRLAAKHVERAAEQGARIYHYRAGFGGQSVEVARRHGMITLCDHSIAHPATVEFLVNNMGGMPAQAKELKLTPFNTYILEDIERADAVVVNSDFVKDTFTHVGHSRSPVHVIYWGVDQAFLDQVPNREANLEQPKILFAGYFQKRKGAETVAQALLRLDDVPWRLEIAGDVGAEIANQYGGFLSDPRVSRLGLLSRRELANVMSRADILVFPSLAEGSARVIFEAMACGCYVITTPNTGSIVQDGVHGRLIPPGDSDALAIEIRDALSNPLRVAEIGRENARLIRMKYRQGEYGEKLAALYGELLASRTERAPVEIVK